MRMPRRLHGVPSAELPTGVEFDAYVGPAREITVDTARGILAIHDGLTPGGKQIRVSDDPPQTVYPQVRLSLDGLLPATSADYVGITSIFALPSGGQLVPIFDGSTGFVARSMPNFIELKLDSNVGHSGAHVAGKNFDVFAAFVAGGVVIGTAAAWTSDVVRGAGAGTTETESFLGLPVNKNAVNLRTGLAAGDVVSVPPREGLYLGGFRATANGQATDSRSKRLVFNAFNQRPVAIGVRDLGDTWDYAGVARQAHGLASNRIEVFLGLAGVAVEVTALSIVNHKAVSQYATCGIGLDSTTEMALGSLQGASFVGVANPKTEPMRADYSGFPGLGFHYLAWLESAGGGGAAQTWYGTNNDTSLKTGMVGSVTL